MLISCIHKHSPPVLILSQINLVQNSPSQFLKIHFILPSHLLLCLSSAFFPSGPPPNALCTSPVFHSAMCPTHHILFDLITRMIFCDKLITRPEKSYWLYMLLICVTWKPREWSGLGLSWTVAPQRERRKNSVLMYEGFAAHFDEK